MGSRTMNYGLDIGRKILMVSTAGKDLNRMLRGVKIVDFSPNRCVGEMKVEQEHANPHGTLHGAFSALLLDGMTTMAIVANGKGVPGLSVEMSTSYLSAAKIGDEIRITANCVKSGKSLAFAECEIRLVKDDKLVVTGKHIKHVEVDNTLPVPGLYQESAV